MNRLWKKSSRAIGENAVRAAVAVAQHEAAGADVLRPAAIDLLRLVQRLAAAQPLDHERIARGRHRALAPVARDEQRVLVLPGHVLLAFGQAEAALDEAPLAQVELAHDIGVAAAVGEADQAAPVVGRQAFHALIDPGLALGPRQRVDVEHGLPLRIVGAVAGEAGAADDAADMGGVLPEIIESVGAHGDGGDAVARLEDLQRPIVITLVARIALELAERAAILIARPGQRPLALDLLEPGERIVRRRIAALRPDRRRPRHRQQPREKQRARTHDPLHAIWRGTLGKRAWGRKDQPRASGR